MKYKTPEVEKRFKDLNPTAQKIADEMDEYAQDKYKIELTMTAATSTLEEDKLLGRVSSTHRERRAWDFRTGDLPEALVAELKAIFNKRYGRLGAVASATPQLFVDRPHGTGPHLHCQLNRTFSLKEIKY
jgi:hypothetical protein